MIAFFRRLLGLGPREQKIPPHVAEINRRRVSLHARLASFREQQDTAKARLEELREGTSSGGETK